MYGIYYKTPIKFESLMEKRDLEKLSLEYSIAQYINLVITTSYGECKFDELLGCRLWELDFDLLMNVNSLRDRMKKDMKDAIKMHENRLDLIEVEIRIGAALSASYNSAMRMKKKVSLLIEGSIVKTNRPFRFQGHFFVGPLSYI